MNTHNWQAIKIKIWDLKPRLVLTRARAAILILGFVALWGLLWLGITTQTAGVGQRVRELDAQVELTVRENAQLQYDIAVLTQPDRIIKRATALGMRPVSPSQTVYLDIKYAPRAAYVPENKTVEPPAEFDWATWVSNALASVGLGFPSRTAEASP